MFGSNKVEGQRYFKDAADDALLVTSVFYTIQGEGPFMGQPAVFIRLAKCNLACSFCDTYFDAGDWYDLNEIVIRAKHEIGKRFPNQNVVPRVGAVITGGEPMLQPGIGKLAQRLERENFGWVQIETNGIVYKPLPQSTTLVVSPKVVDTQKGYSRPHKAVADRATCLKFVLSADHGSPYHKVPLWAHEWRKATGRLIYVSPMNIYKRMPAMAQALMEKRQPTIDERNAAEVVSFWDNDLLDMKANERNHTWAKEYALDNAFCVSPQMHLYLGAA